LKDTFFSFILNSYPCLSFISPQNLVKDPNLLNFSNQKMPLFNPKCTCALQPTSEAGPWQCGLYIPHGCIPVEGMMNEQKWSAMGLHEGIITLGNLCFPCPHTSCWTQAPTVRLVGTEIIKVQSIWNLRDSLFRHVQGIVYDAFDQGSADKHQVHTALLYASFALYTVHSGDAYYLTSQQLLGDFLLQALAFHEQEVNHDDEDEVLFVKVEYAPQKVVSMIKVDPDDSTEDAVVVVKLEDPDKAGGADDDTLDPDQEFYQHRDNFSSAIYMEGFDEVYEV
jgi:hypothetical protein